MKKRILCLLMILLVLLPSFALAGRQYIIPDSDKRELTWDELWGWDYESLGFILNEIFARHGFNFIVGEKFYNYFTSRPWYTPNANSNNSQACYPKLSALEWQNEQLVKEVRAEMRAQKTTNPSGKHYLDYIEGNFDTLTGFTLGKFKTGQKLNVYSAPSAASYRAANGKASVSTNGAVYVAGWENGWLLVMYLTNNNSVRVGYVDGNSIKGTVNAPALDFAYEDVTVLQNVSLTDDPAATMSAIVNLRAGDKVTYLASYQNRNSWAYVETTVNGQTVRGFVRSDLLDYQGDLDENETVGQDNWK